MLNIPIDAIVRFEYFQIDVIKSVLKIAFALFVRPSLNAYFEKKVFQKKNRSPLKDKDKKTSVYVCNYAVF